MAHFLVFSFLASLSLAAYIPSKPVQELVLNACLDGSVQELRQACQAAREEANGMSVNYCFIGEDKKFPWSLAASNQSKINVLLYNGASSRCNIDVRYHIPATAVIRFGKFNELKKLLADGHPIIASSSYSEKQFYNVISEMCRTEYRIDYQTMVLKEILDTFDVDKVFVNQPDWYGLTPMGHLFQSPSNGPDRAPLLLRVLLEHGANPYAEQVDHKGIITTPIEDLFREYKTCQFGLKQMLEMILEAAPIPADFNINQIIMRHVPSSQLKIWYMLKAAESKLPK